MQINRKKKLDIIIPVYNSETTLTALLDEILGLKSILEYELGVILVNDGSTDSSLAICNSYCTKFKSIQVINLSKNFGQHSAIFAGLSNSKADFVLTMDDDGQHLPSSIETLLHQMRDGIDVVYGIAEIEEHSLLRNLASIILKQNLFRLLGIKNARYTSAFRLIRREIFRSVNFETLSSGFLEVVIGWNTSNIAWVKVPMSKRLSGKSNYSARKLFSMAINMVTSYSTLPLRLATFIGFTGFVISLGVSSFYLYKAINDEINVAGFASIMIITGLLGSVQLITLGILGEYIGKIHEKNIGKPNFVVRSISLN